MLLTAVVIETGVSYIQLQPGLNRVKFHLLLIINLSQA